MEDRWKFSAPSKPNLPIDTDNLPDIKFNDLLKMAKPEHNRTLNSREFWISAVLSVVLMKNLFMTKKESKKTPKNALPEKVPHFFFTTTMLVGLIIQCPRLAFAYKSKTGLWQERNVDTLRRNVVRACNDLVERGVLLKITGMGGRKVKVWILAFNVVDMPITTATLGSYNKDYLLALIQELKSAKKQIDNVMKSAHKLLQN